MGEKFSISSHKGVIHWFLQNPVAANLLMVVILILGLTAFSSVRLESFPQLPSNFIIVTIPYEGGTPEEVEQGVAITVEKAIDGIPGIKSIYSESFPTKATLEVEVKEGYDLSIVMQRISGKIEAIENFPEKALSPIISHDVEQANVVWVNIRGDVSEHTLKEIATDLRDKLLLKQNITTVDHYGLRNYEISINFSQEKLSEYNLTFDEIAGALQQSSLDLGMGSLKTETGHILLRVNESKRTGYEFGNVLIRSDEAGNTLYLRDIANIVDGFESENIISMFNGVPSIMLEIKTEGDTDLLEAYSEVESLVEEYQNQVPDVVSVVLWNNMTREISDRLNFFASGGLIGMLLVLLMLAVFLDVKLAFWVAIGIPVSFAGAMTLMVSPLFGFTLNAITLFAFILVLGIIVDDAIIIGESVFREKKVGGSGDGQSITLKGVKAVSFPATFGVLTTVAAFWPLTQLTSEIGLLLGQLAWVVIFCLLFSLVESKLILPTHLKNINVNLRYKKENSISRRWGIFQCQVGSGLSWVISQIYTPAVKQVTQYRYLTCMAFVSLLFISIALMNNGTVKSIFFPEMDQEYLQANFELSSDVTLEEAKRLAQKITGDIQSVSEDLVRAGETELNSVKGVFSQVREKQIVVVAELEEMSKREVSGNEISKLWRQRTGSLPGVDIARFQIREPDIEIEMYGENLESLKVASEALVEKLRTYSVVTDVYRNVKEVREEIKLSLTDLGRSRGISEETLSSQVRNAFYGLEVQRIQLNEEINVVLRFEEEKRASISDLLAMEIVDAKGNKYELGSLVELEIVPGLDQISRENGKKVIVVKASVNKSQVSPDDIVDQLEANFVPRLMKQYTDVKINYSGDVEDDDAAQQSLVRAFCISILLIYILLAIPLKSYTKPLVIVAVIPFGLIGALIGHIIIGIPFSILSFFGLLALGGVLINDSLILVSSISMRRKNGETIEESIVGACKYRFRSVVLTSFTTFVGLIPFIFDSSYQAQFLIPTAVSLGFGILFSTGIILLMIPSLYWIAYDIKNFIKSMTRGARMNLVLANK